MRTRLYIIANDGKIELYGDPVSEGRISNRTLREHQEMIGRELRLTVEFVDDMPAEPLLPCLVADASVFFTGRYLADFLAEAKTIGANCIAGVAADPPIDLIFSGHPSCTLIEGGALYDLRYLVDPDDEDYEAILLEMDDLSFAEHRVPKAIHESTRTGYIESSRAILHIEAPLHLYQANMHQNVAAIAELFGTAGALGWHTRPKLKVDEHHNVIGHNCNIHPSAVVEGSIIGNEVMIGPQSVVRYSQLADNAAVSESSVVYRSILGRHAAIHAQTRVMHSVMYDESFLSNTAWQFSLMGYGAGVFAAFPTDTRLQHETVETFIAGKRVDSGMRTLGCMMGHRAKVACGAVIAPGRLIPNETVIYAFPDMVISRVPDWAAGGTYILGTREPPKK